MFVALDPPGLLPIGLWTEPAELARAGEREPVRRRRMRPRNCASRWRRTCGLDRRAPFSGCSNPAAQRDLRGGRRIPREGGAAPQIRATKEKEGAGKGRGRKETPELSSAWEGARRTGGTRPVSVQLRATWEKAMTSRHETARELLGTLRSVDSVVRSSRVTACEEGSYSIVASRTRNVPSWAHGAKPACRSCASGAFTRPTEKTVFSACTVPRFACRRR